jgi:hypothetical protein
MIEFRANQVHVIERLSELMISREDESSAQEIERDSLDA